MRRRVAMLVSAEIIVERSRAIGVREIVSARDGCCNAPTIMARMLAVRYLTLTALVIWVGGLVTVRWLLASTAQAVATLPVAGYVCGAVMLLGLLVLKFVGPPPPPFFLRAALGRLRFDGVPAS